MSLNGKRALITGASGALGAAVAQRLARDGATVLLHANSRPQAVEELAAAITAAGGQAECHVFDLGSDEASRAACERILAGGPVQILVNNAGVHDDAVLPGMSAAQWHKVIDVSLNGFFRVTQPLLLPMLRTRWGRIINMSSVASLPATAARSTTRRRRVRSTARPRRCRSRWRRAASRSMRSPPASSPRPWPTVLSTRR